MTLSSNPAGHPPPSPPRASDCQAVTELNLQASINCACTGDDPYLYCLGVLFSDLMGATQGALNLGLTRR